MCISEKFNFSLIPSIKVIDPKSTFFIFQIMCNIIISLYSQGLSSRTRRAIFHKLHSHEGSQYKTFNFIFRLCYLYGHREKKKHYRSEGKYKALLLKLQSVDS